MKQELLHVTKSLSSILSRVFNSIFICASNSFRACLVVVMIIAGMVGAVQQTQANGGIAYKGIYIKANGVSTWYNVHDVSWGYACTNYDFRKSSGATSFSGKNFGTVTELKLQGYAVIGWTDNTADWVTGKLEYKIWKQGDAEPSYTTLEVANYTGGSAAADVICSNGNDRVVGRDNLSTDLINGLSSGTYNFKIKGYGKMRWSGGEFNSNDGSEITATFTICTPPSAFTFSNINRISCTQANMAWSASAPALLVRYLGSSPSITNPTSGQSYSSGNTIGNGTVVYSGTADNYTATFDADKIYTFVLYRVSPSGYCYSTSASTTLAAGVPALTTATATSVGGTVATLGGNISSKGSSDAILSRGIEWTLTVGGKTAGNREEIDQTNATGAFSKSFTGLTSGTTYKYKAYATNNSCSSSYGYGAEESFTTSTSCSTPTSGFAASGTYNSGNWTTRFANDYRTASLSTNQVADAYLWECTSANSSKVSIASNTSKTTNATFDLPGEYTFRVGAKCTADGGGYTYSQTVTVNVPYPEIGISGPFYDGTWNHEKAGTDGKFSRSGLVYTKDFTVNTSNGEFVIIQAYKLGCEKYNGWDGYQECNGDGKGNKINCSTLNTSTINTGSCGNFTQKVSLSNGQTARLTVTMTAYDSYTMLLGPACTTPTATQYPMTNATQTYTGGSLSPTITPAAGAGTVSKVYYDNVEGTGKTNAGTYAIKVDVNAGTTYCSATGISLGNFVINKADQAAISAINGVSGTLCTGVEYTLSITGGSGTGTVTYTKESGDATATITGNKITFTGSGTYKIKAVKAADTNYNESSAAYTSDLTINAGSVGGTATASASSVCSGSGTTITLTGNTGTIQWQSSTNGTDYSDISGATSSPLSTGNLTVKTWYRAKVTSGSCSTAYSSVADVTVNPASVGGTATATASSVCSGSGTTISLSGNTGTIQWQSSTDGTNYSDISGATSSPLSTGNLTVKTWYKAKVTSGSCSAAYSSVADVTVNPASVGGTATATASSVCSGSGTTITLTGNTGTIQWQSSTNGTDYSDISGATSSPLSTGNLTVKTWYRAKVTSGSCSTANSSVATVDVTTMPAVSITSGPDKMCGSLTTAGTYTATSVTGASYTWSDNVDGLSEYSKTDNSVTFTTGAVVSSGKIYVYATLSGCNSNTAEKSVAIVTRPTVTGTTGASRCGTGTVDISATVSGGSVDWYDAASAGTKKGSSASSANFTTASLSENTTFYAEANDGGCLSATRTAAAVTIKTSPVLSAITGSATTTQYKPETYTASGSNLGTLTWAIVGAPAHANISATTGSSTVFKAKDGSYTLSVTATNDGCTDNETKGITVSTDSETCP